MAIDGVEQAVVAYLDIPYSHPELHSPLHKFDIYVPKEIRLGSLRPLICFVHGGAWRSEDKSDHAGLALKLASSTGFPVAVPNYRLTPKEPTPGNYLRHPEHAKDIIHFLEFICAAACSPLAESYIATTESGATTPTESRIIPGLPYEAHHLFLLGHSCAAHMLCSIFLSMPAMHSGPSREQGLCLPATVLARTAALILSEGIYDIDTLLSSFPKYRNWFIESVFGEHDSYANVSVTKATTRQGCEHIQWLIVHSKGDTLVDERQSQAMFDHLKSQSVSVCKSFDELFGEHNQILHGDQFVDIVYKHVQKVSAPE